MSRPVDDVPTPTPTPTPTRLDAPLVTDRTNTGQDPPLSEESRMADAAAGSPRPVPATPQPRQRLPRRPLILLVTLATALGVTAYRFSHTASLAPAELTLLGNIDVRQVNLSFKVGGRIESLFVDEGDSVVAGQTIAALTQSYFEDGLRLAQAQRDQVQANYDRLRNGSRPEEIEEAQAQTATARAALARAEQDYKRSAKLIRENAIATADYDLNRAAYLEAQAALKSAEASQRLVEMGPRAEDIAAGRAQLDAATAQVVIAQRQLTDAELVAPHDGIILTRAREVGAIVNAGETVATLTLASPVWVRTYVGEPDLGNVQPGLAVTITTDTSRGHTYRGKVGFISPTAEFTPKSVETRELRTSLVYRLRIVVADPDGGLRQGMPVTVSVALPGTRPRSFRERLLEALGLGTRV